MKPIDKRTNSNKTLVNNALKKSAFGVVLALSSSLATAATFNMQKNETGYSIDGNGGAVEGQQLYLWTTKTTNTNQNWVQISHGDGYYSYKKEGTSLCWDGGSGGAKRQAVTLEVCDSSNYDQHWKKVKVTSGTEIYRIEKRNAPGYSIDGNSGAELRQSLYLWTSSSSNINQQWELTRTDDTSGGGSGGGTGGGDHNLDASKAPSGNFDLLDWYLSIPVDEGDGYATSVKEVELAASYEDNYFYTGSDGGMVFYTPVKGVTTSSGTKYVRTELREMLRRGNTSYSTSGKDNNWAFSSIPSSSQSAFGGIDGVLDATLAVNHVTTTSSNNEQVGRIVIGQIHAEGNEPIRLYYHKLPGNSNGALYFAHETSKSDGGNETWYNLLGSMVSSNGDLSSTSNPSNGIALNEEFSYTITVNGDSLTAKISQNGSQLASKTINMSGSGYDDSSNYMYFKAGIYLQDNSSNDSDYAKVTFYKLTNTHDNYNP
ncbi:polysaccharide lyase family 7 protein [Agarivorans sp. Alg241-V36]|uniref:polysaccharide lyase family 7 protein n=1 Tax=Agarivorans sp. Alg241-V36 TaxID=2305992 RepID=UPI001F0712C7|nr:polysaccharide lyase family 7 protein [Agarivorans sp. Alg241-V36]